MRRALSLILLSAALGLPATAAAKSPKKMSDAELLTELASGDKEGRRAAAAEELGARHLGSAAEALGATCGGDPSPEVCKAALEALASIGTASAWEALQGVLERPGAPAEARLRALEILLERAPDRFDAAAPGLVAAYRGLDPALGTALFEAVAARGLSQLSDAAMFAALDDRADRALRLAALDAAEGFGNPRLYEGFVAFLKDRDRDLRVRCAEGLNRPNLPGSVVVPALIAAANEDPEGSVRAAALVSLRQYAHTELLDEVLHVRIVEDHHPYAWESALELLVVLADESSLKPLYKVMDEREYLKDEVLSRLVDLVASIDKQQSIAPIMSVEQRHQGTELAEHCREVLAVLDSEFDEWPRPKPAVDFTVWVPGEPDPRIPALSVSMGPDNVLTGL